MHLGAVLLLGEERVGETGSSRFVETKFLRIFSQGSVDGDEVCEKGRGRTTRKQFSIKKRYRSETT